MKEAIIATNHCISRMKERCNVKNAREATRKISLAIQRGKRAEEFGASERSYLNGKMHGNCIAIAYDNHCYIVSDKGCCITLFPLPSWFGKKQHYLGKELIREYRKCCRRNLCACEYGEAS